MNLIKKDLVFCIINEGECHWTLLVLYIAVIVINKSCSINADDGYEEEASRIL